MKTAISETNWDEAMAPALDEGGKIVAGGWVYEGKGTCGNTALVRNFEDGALDPGFGAGGVVVTEVGATSKIDAANALVLQRDERVPTVRVLLAGAASTSNFDFAVTRFWR